MMNIKILHLYPKEMNLYGDHGNILSLKRRLEWRGYSVSVINYEPGMDIPDDVDIIFGGGGQDSGQSKIEKDLILIAPKIKKMIDDGTPALVICGLYQLFGSYFLTSEGQKIQGMGILDAVTTGGNTRLIGNVVIESELFGQVVGYENHSGLTVIGSESKALGKVVKGCGNNGTDGYEGIIYKNCIGTYLHGPVLPKNPKIADYLIQKSLEKKSGSSAVLSKLDDTIEYNAHNCAASRPR